MLNTQQIGNKIAEARKKTNLSQAQLAQHLSISPQAVGKWERGESLPDIMTLNRLAEILNVDLNYFSDKFLSSNEEKTIIVEYQNDNEQTIKNNVSYTPEREMLNDFSGSNLTKSDFAGVTAHKRKFIGSALQGSDFSGADLSGSSFTGSDINEANFDGANLTDCTLFASSLKDTCFNNTILVRTKFSASDLAGAKFTNSEFINVTLSKNDLRQTIFENCVFHGVDFKYTDMQGLHLDGQTFIGVKFHKVALNEATFKGATLKNVSFSPTYALTNKYYRALNTIHFDGAMMDKLTYAALKGFGVDLSKVTMI